MSLNTDYVTASPEQIITDLGRRIEQIRLSRNITQQQLADRSGLSLSTVKRLERGDAPTLETLVRAMNSLGLRSQLEALVPDQSIRPVDRVKLKGHERRRAAPTAAPPKAAVRPGFIWGDQAASS